MKNHTLEYFVNSAIPEAHYSLSQQVQDYIALSERFSIAHPEPTIAEIRQCYQDYCQHIAGEVDYPASRLEETIDSQGYPVALRHYVPENLRDDARILFLHGGGFVVGDLESHDSVCAHLAERTQMCVTAVDYRLAPEHKFPAAFEDCLAVWQYLKQHSDTPIILCGDSAGGTLAAALSGYCLENHLPMPQGQVLLYPYLGGDPSAGSYQRYRNAPMLSLKEMHDYARYYYGDHLPSHDPRALPLRALHCAGLPATAVFVAEIDPLADDGILYVQRLKAAGVPAQSTVLRGLPHGFIRAWAHIDAVRDCWTQMITALENLAQGRIAL